MLTKQTILNTLKAAKGDLEQKYFVRSLALFGSYSRNVNNSEAGDIDLMVEFSQPIGIRFVDLADELEEMLKHKVDLISRNGIKPKYFQAIKEDLIYI